MQQKPSSANIGHNLMKFLCEYVNAPAQVVRGRDMNEKNSGILLSVLTTLLDNGESTLKKFLSEQGVSDEDIGTFKGKLRPAPRSQKHCVAFCDDASAGVELAEVHRSFTM